MAIANDTGAPVTPSSSSAGTLPIVTARAGTNVAAAASGYSSGSSANLVGIINDHAARADLAGRVFGAYFVLDGLTISAGTGLKVTVAWGTAMIDGPVQPAGGINPGTGATQSVDVTVPGSTAKVYIWLKRDGTLTTTTTKTPPSSTPCVCLGFAVTGVSTVTSVDMSGVLRGGILHRTSTDSGAPTDTPPSSLRIVTKTATGLYYWDGSSHLQIGIPQLGSDPSSPVNGDVWIRTDTSALSARIGGSTKRVTLT